MIHWWIEGIAEYVEFAPIAGTTLNISGKMRRIQELYEAEQTKRYTVDMSISIPDFKAFFRSLNWSADEMNDPISQYAVSGLMFYYFCHEDGKGKGKAMIDYTIALRKGMTHLEAEPILLQGRSHNELYQDLQKFWKKYGVILEVGPAKPMISRRRSILPPRVSF